MSVELKSAFLHLVYEYRYLATAGFAWEATKKGSKNRAAINHLIPEASTVAQDSLLVHVRSLIEFYTKKDPRPDDIVLAGFSDASHTFTVDTTLPDGLGQLKDYVDSISVNVLHVTDWREVSHRTANATTTPGLTRQRPDWNTVNTVLAVKLLDTLQDISKQPSEWGTPFAELHRAATKRFTEGPQFIWPTLLSEKSEVDSYLAKFGL